MIDLAVVLVLGIALAVVLGRKRLPGLGRGFGTGVREFRRAKEGLPPPDQGDEGPEDSRRDA
jgi:Sec-independent protein translocase protein TatA